MTTFEHKVKKKKKSWDVLFNRCSCLINDNIIKGKKKKKKLKMLHLLIDLDEIIILTHFDKVAKLTKFKS